MLLPSGDHDRLLNCSALPIDISFTIRPLGISTTSIRLRPLLNTLKANCFPSGDQVPADSIKLNSSTCVFDTLLVSFRNTCPVLASAKYRSTVKRSFSDKNAKYLPSGLTDGARFILPEFLSLIRRWPVGN